MMTYRPGGVDEEQLTLILPLIAALGYCPHNGYAPLTGALTAEDVLVTPTMNRSRRFSKKDQKHTVSIFKFRLKKIDLSRHCSGRVLDMTFLAISHNVCALGRK